MVNLWLNLDFCYVSGIKRGSLDFLGGFFRPSSLDLISGPTSDTSAFFVASMKSMSYHCLEAFGRNNANRTTGNSERRQT